MMRHMLCGGAIALSLLVVAEPGIAQANPTGLRLRTGTMHPNASMSRAQQMVHLQQLRLPLADSLRKERSRAPYLLVGALVGASVGAFATYKALEDCTCMFLHPVVAVPTLGGAGLGVLGGFLLFADARATDRRNALERR